MYNMPYYKQEDEETIKQFVGQHPFAFLSGCDKAGKPVATQIPMFLELNNSKKVLRGHMMKNTDHHKAFAQNPNVLAVFTGPNTYVSGAWYSNPHTASTWNYMSVQVAGEIHFVDDAGLADIMREITLHFEENNEASPTVYDNLPSDFIASASTMIVGFEIDVVSIEAIFKLSQDRDEQSFKNIINKLNGKDYRGKEIAQEMKNIESTLFPKE